MSLDDDYILPVTDFTAFNRKIYDYTIAIFFALKAIRT